MPQALLLLAPQLAVESAGTHALLNHRQQRSILAQHEAETRVLFDAVVAVMSVSSGSPIQSGGQ